MKYLVDSDYVADYLGARPHAIQLLSSFVKDDLSISIITYGEIYEGIHYVRNHKLCELSDQPLTKRYPFSTIDQYLRFNSWQSVRMRAILFRSMGEQFLSFLNNPI